MLKRILATAQKAASVVVITVAFASATNAGLLLLDNVTSNPSPPSDASDEIRQANYGILARIDVNAVPVTIDQFGVYGQMTTDGNLNFAIFQPDGTRLYQSALQATVAAATLQWYDSPLFSLALAANTTYYMGVIADQRFVYHWFHPGTTITQNGLTSLGGGLAGNNGNFSNSSDPILIDTCCFVQQGTRVFGDAAVVPEPGSLALLGLGMTGLAFVRRRKAAR
ncbi:MAG: PEP-CTERM sorting domain-containing protein [Candidatus Contendobacter sp.]|nr:PEP-CTERM sorting domain-containing protein [Candidatus Contendobacter sp.]